jgi:glycosyltransferase involved in cell wall biosynthesis
VSKILYIGGFELPDKNAAAHRVLSNSKALRDLGHDIIFLGINSENDNKITLQDHDGFRCFSINYPRGVIGWFSTLTSFGIVKKLILKENPDLIICYNYYSLPLFKLLSYAKKNSIKVIGDITEWYEPQGNIIFRAIKWLDVFFRMKILNKRLDGIIVISDYLENYYDAYFEDNILKIPPLVDLLEKKWKLRNSKKVNKGIGLVYAGSPAKGKDDLGLLIAGLLKVNRSVSDVISLCILGQEKDDFLRRNAEFVDQDLSFVQFLGRVSHLDSLMYLRASDFSVFFRERNLPNTAGFPTKFVEAISLGVPVITNNFSNIATYFVDNKMGFLIDELEVTSIENLFLTVVKLKDAEIEELKYNCLLFKEFDYRHYIASFNSFILRVLDCK